jgi:hypothetical protein
VRATWSRSRAGQARPVGLRVVAVLRHPDLRVAVALRRLAPRLNPALRFAMPRSSVPLGRQLHPRRCGGLPQRRSVEPRREPSWRARKLQYLSVRSFPRQWATQFNGATPPLRSVRPTWSAREKVRRRALVRRRPQTLQVVSCAILVNWSKQPVPVETPRAGKHRTLHGIVEGDNRVHVKPPRFSRTCLRCWEGRRGRNSG